MNTYAPTPYVLPHDDGEHFWWFHLCWDYLGEQGARRDRVTETMLPLGGDGWKYDKTTDTITPSILCHRCETHGWWSYGKWFSCK